MYISEDVDGLADAFVEAGVRKFRVIESRRDFGIIGNVVSQRSTVTRSRMPRGSTKTDEIQFVHVQNQDDNKPAAACTAIARSYLMKKYHRQKQVTVAQQAKGFRHVTQRQMKTKQQQEEELLDRIQHKSGLTDDSPLAAKFDPFSCMAADSSELPLFLDNPMSRQAGEPVINFHGDMGYQSLQLVFRAGISDAALLNSMLMSLTFAINGDPNSVKFLKYKGETLRWLNERLRNPATAVTAATIGAILLLIGVEARLGHTLSVQAHKKGIGQLVELCGLQSVHLHDGIKRAMFWTDLFSAILTGSPRILNHELFSELAWKRDPLCKYAYKVPTGFEAFAELLGDEFLTITEDINALKCVREINEVDLRDSISVMHLDNQQASIESRLYDLAYLCTYALFTEVWASSLLPDRLTKTLLERLQSMQGEQHMNNTSGLFLWIMTVGGVFSGSVQQQAAYADLIHQEIEITDSTMTGESLLDHLEKFLWSRKHFNGRWKDFWGTYETIPDRKHYNTPGLF